MVWIIFGFSLLFGLAWLWLLVERHQSRIRRRAEGLLCLAALLMAGSTARELSMQAMGRSERAAPRAAATDGNGSRTLPNGTLRLASDRRELTRYETVVDEIGPPPTPDAVPVVGYTTREGLKFPSRWRARPNDVTGDNLK